MTEHILEEGLGDVEGVHLMGLVDHGLDRAFGHVVVVVVFGGGVGCLRRRRALCSAGSTRVRQATGRSCQSADGDVRVLEQLLVSSPGKRVGRRLRAATDNACGVASSWKVGAV
jgi:hypothetical protein